MKRKALFSVFFVLYFAILSVLPVSASETVLANGISDKATVQLFAPYGSTEVFAYKDGETHILKTDGSAACTTAYPASQVFLRGKRVSAVTPMADFTAIQRFDASTLTQTDFFGVEIPKNDLLAVDTDSFGRVYAVKHSEPDVLYIFDAAGSFAGTISCPVNIQRIQVLENRLYLFLPEQCMSVSLDQSLPTSASKAFSYSASAAPVRMLSTSAYLGANGVVYSASGASLKSVGHYALRESCLAYADSVLFWAGEDCSVMRCSLSNNTVSTFSLYGTAVALTDSAAVVKSGSRYLLVPYGTFVSPTPTPTAAAPVPTASVQKPAATAKPTATTASAPTPSPIPGVHIEGSYIYVPADTTAAVLRKTLPYAQTEIYTSAMTTASGKVRTGWIAVTADSRYTLIVPGDVNSSGTVNKTDLQIMQQFLLGIQHPEKNQRLAGDINGNGSIDAADLVLLVRLMQ